MRRLAAVVVLCVLLTACGGQKAESTSYIVPGGHHGGYIEGENVLVIKEDMYAAQCDDITFHPEDYADKTIVIEGMYLSQLDEAIDYTLHMVYRFGPGGCCGNDGYAGLQIHYDGEYPEHDTWIRLVGNIEQVNIGYPRPVTVLNVQSMEFPAERGAEYVIS